MNTVAAEFVWTHENAGQVPWADTAYTDSIEEQSAWLSGMLELSVWREPTGFWAWGVTIWTGHYPFANDQELCARTGYLSMEFAKFDAIRTACRWLVGWDADGWLESLQQDQWDKEQAAHEEYLASLSEDEQRFDAAEYAGRTEPHADLQRWD